MTVSLNSIPTASRPRIPPARNGSAARGHEFQVPEGPSPQRRGDCAFVRHCGEASGADWTGQARKRRTRRSSMAN
jgi:hypothetical protein